MSLYNVLHGRNPFGGLYLTMLGLKPDEVPRLRDVHLAGNEGNRMIAVYTRMGGGNRGHWGFSTDNAPGPECDCNGCRANHVLGGHPLYLYDEDDDFDSTYATYYFKVPERYADKVEEMVEFPAQTDDPEENMRRLIDKLREGEEDDAEVEAAKEAMQPLMEDIKSALEGDDE